MMIGSHCGHSTANWMPGGDECASPQPFGIEMESTSLGAYTVIQNHSPWVAVPQRGQTVVHAFHARRPGEQSHHRVFFVPSTADVAATIRPDDP
jgi:hypothetical protein